MRFQYVLINEFEITTLSSGKLLYPFCPHITVPYVMFQAICAKFVQGC